MKGFLHHLASACDKKVIFELFAEGLLKLLMPLCHLEPENALKWIIVHFKTFHRLKLSIEELFMLTRSPGIDALNRDIYSTKKAIFK